MKNIQFSPPDIGQLEIDEVIDTLKSGWITTGPKTKKFETMIAEFVDSNRAVCLASQTACAEMTLRILGVGYGDEVVIPAYTYTATASVIAHVGATIVMVDCEKDRFTWDYHKLEDAITEKTKVIIPVDLAGIPCDYDRIYEIVNRKKSFFSPKTEIQKKIGRIIVMADGAHAFGASYGKKKVGVLADFTNFSFHAVKNLTTAEGGAVTWNLIDGIDDEEIYKEYMLLSLHGQSKDALHKNKLGAWEYDVVAPLYKCNMTDIQASLGIAQLTRYTQILGRRKEIISKYNEAFSSMPIRVLPHYTNEYSSSGHLYLMRIEQYDCDERNAFITKMAERGVACNVHYKPLPLLSAYKNLDFDIIDYPNAYKQFVNEVTLPLHTCLTDEDVEYIIMCVRECLEKRK